MRLGITFAAATVLTAMLASSAYAEEWCGYRARDKSIVECGYSTVADCESATGKGGMCFVDPDYAANIERAAHGVIPQVGGLILGDARR